MDRLKGKTILIGKEPGQGRLLVAIQGSGKTGAIGTPGSVPACVSRCKPAEGVAHAKLMIDQNGNMVLYNMKSQNVTFVNGSAIASKRVSSTNAVELGKDRFSINLPVVLEAAKKLAGTMPPPPATPIDISHLRRVWEEYHDQARAIKIRQKKLALWSRIPMFFTMGGTVISGISVALQWPSYVRNLCFILTVVGLLIMLVAFYKSKNDTSIEDAEKLSEKFIDSYKCPSCKKYFPGVAYKVLLNQLRNINDNKMYCPHCKRELIER